MLSTGQLLTGIRDLRVKVAMALNEISKEKDVNAGWNKAAEILAIVERELAKLED